MNVFLLYANKPFSAYEKYLPFASAERVKKINSLKAERDKTNALLSHLFARYKLSQELNLPFSEVSFLYNEHGKPLVESCHFSISHCDNLIAFTSHISPIGIDVEKIRQNLPSSFRFFTHNEKSYISSDPLRFFEIWTKKEAYVKMLGTGLTTPLSSFDVQSDSLKPLLHSIKFDDFFLSICAESITKINIITEYV